MQEFINNSVQKAVFIYSPNYQFMSGFHYVKMKLLYKNLCSSFCHLATNMNDLPEKVYFGLQYYNMCKLDFSQTQGNLTVAVWPLP